MTQMIDGKAISAKIKEELKAEVGQKKEEGKEICLAVVQVGNDAASCVYVNNKKKACAFVGIKSLAYELEETVSEEELLLLIEKLNQDEKVNGILVIASFAGTYFRGARDQCNLSFQGCGWIPSCECRKFMYRKKRISALYTCGHYPAFKTLRSGD